MAMLVDEFLKYKKYRAVCFDTETESLNLATSRPWQISYVTFDPFKIGNLVNDFLLWQDLNVSAGAAKITRFKKDQYIKKAVDPMNPLRQFIELTSQPEMLIVGHNIIGFDVYQLKNATDALNIEVNWPDFLSKCIDTYALAKAEKMDIQPPKSITPIERYFWQKKVLNAPRIRGLKLSDVVQGDENMLHNAEYDIQLNVQAFKELIKKINIC